MKNLGIKRSQLAVPVAFVHVDTAQLEDNHEFELSIAQNASLEEKVFKLKLLEHPLQEVTCLKSKSKRT